MASTNEIDSSRLMLIALRFNEKINQRDLEGLAGLITDDHIFIDNFGEITKGKDAMKEGWREFFEKYPDYRNIFTCVTVKDNIAIMTGYSTCSYKPLDGPSIWTARIVGDRVAEWRVYWLDKR